MTPHDLLSQALRQKALLTEAIKKLERLPEPDRETILVEYRALLDNADAIIEAAESRKTEGLAAHSQAREAYRMAARMEAIVNNLSAGVLVYDPAGKVQLANGYAIALFGFDPLGLDKVRLLQKVKAFDQEGQRITAENAPGTRAAAGEIVVNQPLTLHNRLGRSYSVLASAMPIYVGRDFQGVVAVWNDITGQQNLIAERDQQNEVLQAIFAANPGGLAVISLPDMVYRMSNQAYQETTPHAQRDLVGRTVGEVWSPQEEAHLKLHFKALVQSGEQANHSYQIPGADGSTRFFERIDCPIHWNEQDAILMVVWEVTRLEQARHEAEEGRRILQALMEYVPEGITIAEAPDVTIRMVSKHGQELTGRPAEELTGMPAEAQPQHWQIYSPETNALVPGESLPLSRATQRGEVVENEELIMRRANGEEIAILCNAGPIRDERGQITGGIIAWRNISERRQVMQDLAESEARFRALADNMSQLAWMADSEAKISWYNRRWFDFTGTTLPEVEGWGWRHMHHPDHMQRVFEKIRASFAAGEVWEDTFPLRGADGEYRWFLSRAVPICDEDGRVLRWFGTNTDITELRKAQQAEKASERRFRVALASVPIVVFNMDRELRYTWIYNPRHGASEVNLIGKRDDELYPVEDIAELLAAKLQVIETGQPVEREIRMRVQGDTLHYILSLDPLLDESGQVIGLTGAGLDVTDQRRMEARQMEFATEMEVHRRLLEHRERERQEIAREIHDGPIQSMVSALFNIQFAKDALTDDEAKAVLDQMMGTLKLTVQELREVVNQLRPPVLIRFGLSRAIQIHAEDLRARYPDLQIELELTEDEGLLHESVCLALYRVYQEAITNVVRHANASQVWVRYYPAVTHMLMEIEDNGSGFTMPSDWVHYTRQNHFGVAGMRERVDAVGGKLQVSSAPEKGTMVLVKVPLQANGSATADPG